MENIKKYLVKPIKEKNKLSSKENTNSIFHKMHSF